MKKLFQLAEKKKIAIGHFNVSNVETFEAVVRASKKTRRPVIIATSEGAINHSGLEFFIGAKQHYERKYKIELYLHLDHGRDMDLISQAIHSGYDSVMIDGSHFDFEENVRKTKSIVNQAHRYGVFVEAEIGTIGGAEENITSRNIIFTDPLKAQEFARRTNCDSLAVAIGTSHGIHKFIKNPKLDFRLLEVLNRLVDIPLVLHGASSVSDGVTGDLKSYGVKLEKTVGLSNPYIRKAIKMGIRKVNIDTDLQLVMIREMLDGLYDQPPLIKLYKLLDQASRGMEEEVISKIKLFSGKK